MKGKLTNNAGKVFDLSEVSTIGRSSEAEVTVSDPRASRRHALIRWQEGKFWFFDLGSSNGSYINGRRVTTARALEDSDCIRIGDCLLEFQDAGGAAGQQRHDAEQTIVDMRSHETLILVSDIEGFTALSEKLDPEVLAPMIGTWYREVQTTLEGHGATIDKFIGDCVLAYWLDTSASSRSDSLKAAAAMQEVCKEVQTAHAATLAELGLDFRTGTAVHSGSVVHGAIGAGEFSLLGDAVNLTFRLEALTRTLGKPVLVSGDLFQGWEEGRASCEPCGSHPVKGRVEEIEVFSPTSAS